jgi:Protein of unknown function (DUF3887)
MTHDVPPDREGQARSLFDDLIAGRWEKVSHEFDVIMRGHADAERIARGWTHVADRAGSFEGMGAPSARQSGDYTVMDVPLTFGAGEAIGRVVLNRDGKVAGLSLEYPHRRRLDPRPVQGFVLRNPDVAGFFARF